VATQSSAHSGHNQALRESDTIESGPNPALRDPLTLCIHCLRLSAIGAWFINKGLDSAPSWPYFGKDKERAQNRRASWVNRPTRVLRRLPLITIDTPAALHRWTKRSVRWLLAIQSAEKLQAMGPPMYVNPTPIPPPIEDPTKLLHALWHAARNLPDSVRPSRPRPTLPANPASLDASIAALEELLDWCSGSSVPDTGGSKQVDAHDKKSDNATHKPKKRNPGKRRLGVAGNDCIRRFKERRKTESDATMKSVVEDYVEEVGGTVAAIMRRLNDHPDKWKQSDTKATHSKKK